MDWQPHDEAVMARAVEDTASDLDYAERKAATKIAVDFLDGNAPMDQAVEIAVAMVRRRRAVRRR